MKKICLALILSASIWPSPVNAQVFQTISEEVYYTDNVNLYISNNIMIEIFGITIRLREITGYGRNDYCDIADSLDGLLAEIDRTIRTKSFYYYDGDKNGKFMKINSKDIENFSEIKADLNLMLRSSGRRCS